MVSARFYLLNSMELEAEVLTDWLINAGNTKDELITTLTQCDASILKNPQALESRTSLKTYFSFFRLGGRPAILGSTIKCMVKLGLTDNLQNELSENKTSVAELLGGGFGKRSERFDSLFYFGNFSYFGNSEAQDFKQIYERGAPNTIYEAAKKGTKFRGLIYCRGISKDRLIRYVQLILKALNINPGSDESDKEIFFGRFSTYGQNGKPVSISFVGEQNYFEAIFGGVKFRLIRGCEV